jgi:undecaprenyl pyrophosphate phosphatase UppP
LGFSEGWSGISRIAAILVGVDEVGGALVCFALAFPGVNGALALLRIAESNRAGVRFGTVTVTAFELHFPHELRVAKIFIDCNVCIC